MAVTKRSYSELIRYSDYAQRLNYLKLHGKVGTSLFGENRYFNQAFYHSPEWNKAKIDAIARDNGYDLGIVGLPILGSIFVHHLTPITIEMLERGDPLLTDLDNLICCSDETHRAIHYDPKTKMEEYVDRAPFDTAPWRI